MQSFYIIIMNHNTVWHTILCTAENLRIDEHDCGLVFSIRLTGDINIAALVWPFRNAIV